MLNILEKLQGAALTTSELLEIFVVDRDTHYKRMRGIPIPRRKRSRAWNPEYEARKREEQERHRFYSILTKLRKQKIIQKNRNKGITAWNITSKGLEHIGRLREAIRNAFPSKEKYEQKSASEWIIIIFDIPEKERRKRDWLRTVLKHLKLQKLQKSVWIGKISIPEEFLDDLDNLRILDYVEIFAITRGGSIRQIE